MRWSSRSWTLPADRWDGGALDAVLARELNHRLGGGVEAAQAERRASWRGLLRLDDPLLAAQQFAGMIRWVPVHRVMFCGEDAALPAADIERYAAAGARAFLAAPQPPASLRRAAILILGQDHVMTGPETSQCR
jgi:AefR-like transcriptional repressor, C-terminal domain